MPIISSKILPISSRRLLDGLNNNILETYREGIETWGMCEILCLLTASNF
jgi:hypothetical protein